MIFSSLYTSFKNRIYNGMSSFARKICFIQTYRGQVNNCCQQKKSRRACTFFILHSWHHPWFIPCPPEIFLSLHFHMYPLYHSRKACPKTHKTADYVSVVREKQIIVKIVFTGQFHEKVNLNVKIKFCSKHW